MQVSLQARSARSILRKTLFAAIAASVLFLFEDDDMAPKRFRGAPSELDVTAVQKHLEKEFARTEGAQILFVGHAPRSDIKDDLLTMTGNILEALSHYGSAEITILPAELAPCRADGYTERNLLQSDIAIVGECLVPFVKTISDKICTSSLIVLGRAAENCVKKSLQLAGKSDIVNQICHLGHPCYWERPDYLKEAHAALAKRIDNFMTFEELHAVVKTAGRTKNRSKMPRSKDTKAKTSTMGKRHVEECRKRRIEMEIGTDVAGVQRRVDEGQKLVQICHEMCISSRTLLKTLSNNFNKNATADLVKKLRSTEFNDEETKEDQSRVVDVEFMMVSRTMGFSAHSLSILHPTPISWKDASKALGLTGNIAREVDAPRLRVYEKADEWLSTEEIKTLIKGARSVERVARVLLPSKSAQLKEWIDFVQEVCDGTKEAKDNPRSQQVYLAPAARKRRREEHKVIADVAVSSAQPSSTIASSSSTDARVLRE